MITICMVNNLCINVHDDQAKNIVLSPYKSKLDGELIHSFEVTDTRGKKWEVNLHHVVAVEHGRS